MKLLPVFVFALTGCTTYVTRVINTHDDNSKHCIQKQRVVCEYKTR